ncbi:hypothetical protein ACYCS5_02885 [Paenibacillus sp. SEL3]|uniref:Uncharacterized protein n=1 Tax=Paenibacillus polymyxa TaxID=1406 RepID=A0A8I1IUK4_PAEPO|nr:MULTISPECIES: hypothetical protein [Paenibacillus]KAF6572269.1 hypothetical protein G9G53_15845 [Paenibacillus sp. EKM206P]KAF6586680.1 hypothetical protein G9G52_18850 [Paenibacillus sp. EKM205P]MBM0634918.1 hypothetical protein [Paenibacillus polymyxa]MBO3286328.1 hypothetical protein [Paenibacillus polymyxa]MBP1309771.1 hypothetical protein [Paenibacillus sp. 1182]
MSYFKFRASACLFIISLMLVLSAMLQVGVRLQRKAVNRLLPRPHQLEMKLPRVHMKVIKVQLLFLFNVGY